MELSRILIRELTDYQIIELREAAEDGDTENGEDRRSFPIVIGLPEAQAIERRIKGITVKRPQTHDLLATVIGQLGGELKSITITDLAEHTFFATLDVRRMARSCTSTRDRVMRSPSASPTMSRSSSPSTSLMPP
jgi:bifunctional DNase/RNase